jgi:hypothetical protein
MDVRYRLDYESNLCEHLEKEIVREDGSIYLEVDQLSTDGVIFDVIRPSDRTEDPHATLYLHGTGTIEIADPCDDDSCVELIVRTDKIETTIYLPEGITLTSLDAAICSAIMAKRAKDENR